MIAFLIVLAIPLVMMAGRGRALLVGNRRSTQLWTLLVTGAAAGLLAALDALPISVSNGAATVVALPFMQAVAFVVADQAFQLVVRRRPVPFYKARLGDFRRYWPDRLFWTVICIGLTAGAVFLCHTFDVDFGM